MTRRELRQRADSFLRELVDLLAQLPRNEIAEWPEYPETPSIPLNVPEELAPHTFTLMKDTLPDGRIRVAVQRYRYRFLGIGNMMADGFFLQPDGSIQRFTEEDTWAVT